MSEVEMKVVDNTEYWYKKDTGELHREDGPAVTCEYGRKAWWQNGLRHRDGGLPAVMTNDMEREWWVDGEQHRIGGPAVIYLGGGEEWRVRGTLHRLDGPAIIHDHEDLFGKEVEWYINGSRVFGSTEYMELAGLTQEEMDKLIEQYGDF